MQKNYIKYSNNIKLLNKLKINNNILYFPINNFNYREYKYKKTEKNIDIIFYGSLNKNYFYRNKFILNLIKISKKNKYKLKIFSNLFNKKKKYNIT